MVTIVTRKYRKLPVEIEAMQWTGWNANEIVMWGIKNKFYKIAHKPKSLKFPSDEDVLSIETLEGEHIARVGDYIIKGIAGEFYPCKPEIFDKTYEVVNDS